MAALIALFLFGGQNYPPPYPRDGTTALIDNARAQVWDVSWPKGKPSALHRHLYDNAVKPAGVPVFSAASMPLLDNERVVVWDYPGSAPSRHAHIMDTVVVWTEGRSGHAIFLPAGTVHTPEPIGAGAKATIFELK
jgi:hypothetical protein